MILVRFSLLAALAVFAPVALVGYLLAYMLMIIVLRFVDGLEHDYPYPPTSTRMRFQRTRVTSSGNKSTRSARFCPGATNG
ncbi:MAG: hypothetical protein CM15mP103_06630 [Gammaproteobacteria bacterium]|nr:MAG: hypothetical protein CM15mP103_06630 [Gammaproteobacteria bacterium]